MQFNFDLSLFLLIFATKLTIMNISKSIQSKIKRLKPGSVFFPADFSGAESSRSIHKTLERLVKSGAIIRLSNGVYYYPQIDEKYGLGIIYPSYEEVAKRISERDKLRIVYSGAYASNHLGFSTQVPMNLVYLTDGNSKIVKMSNGYMIKFIHTAPKNLAYKNKIIQMIVLALKDIGKNNLKPEHERKICSLLENIPFEQISDDLVLMPSWIKNLIIKQYEQKVL